MRQRAETDREAVFVGCDIEGFFDNLPHGPLMEILRQRVRDLRLIRKWLRVGWVEEGRRHPGIMKAVRAFHTAVGRLWWWTLRRRSHKAKTRWTWQRFYRLQRAWLPRPRVCHPYPSQRFDAMHSR